VFNKERERKWFCEDIRWHIGSRYPIGTKSTIVDVIANEMMANVDMFGTGSNSRTICKRTGTLIIGEERERSRYGERVESQK